LGILIAVKDHEVLVENRRAAKAMARIELAGYLLPLQVAVASVAGYNHLGYGILGDVLRLAWLPRQVVVFFSFALALQANKDAALVGRRCGAGVTIEHVPWLEWGREHGLLPNDGAVFAVESQEHAFLLLL